MVAEGAGALVAGVFRRKLFVEAAAGSAYDVSVRLGVAAANLRAMPLGPDDVRLDGMVAVVTGAAAGIGAATARALARFGADVAICDRDAEHLAEVAAEVEALGRRAHRGLLDVRDGDQVAAA